ncbi:type II toxin-antitoxin system Phd/YefM family antitoxin [Luteipulveratus mongoliensis]|uniref:Antitoxin n=1 Tax=Luteipulveratus mongoliensis TaxID=571913 RepID=A0A0K1JFQ9_9MICO|nr:type II toxin-antitoxin system prevent-host-death family antitoxin [Luteipulveratus mongoliensis]AKU15536.1 antitoxin [Luteipulveratus mongoliensis]
MVTVNVQHAKTHLSDLLARVERGEDVVIARAGAPVARLVAVGSAPGRSFGPMTFEVPDDFDAPLEGEELAAWE